jgi:hypothetical protein
MKYPPAGKRNPGRPLKRLLEIYTEAGKGHDVQVHKSTMMMKVILVDFFCPTTSPFCT